MKTQKTITVTACDFCINDKEPTWKCAKCERDACRNCCSIYRVTLSRPVLMSGLMAMTISSQPAPSFSATFCNDCGKNEIAPVLLRAGFQEAASGRDVLKDGCETVCAHCDQPFRTNDGRGSLCADCFVTGHRGSNCDEHCKPTAEGAMQARQLRQQAETLARQAGKKS